MFRPRRPHERFEPRIEFLGEQDGPPERSLKSALTEILDRPRHPVRAYLACVGFQPDSERAVALCLAGFHEPDTAVVRDVNATFSKMFGTGAALDMIFISTDQEADLRRVCSCFYDREQPE